MLETLISAANFAKTTSYYMLYGSYKTGYLLVNSVTTLFQYFLTFVDNLITFFIVLYESTAIFLQDILQFLQQVVNFVATSFEVISSNTATSMYKIVALVYSIVDLLVAISTAIVSGVYVTIAGLARVFILFKKLVILFGSGVWFIITLVPLLLYYICVLFVSLINTCYREILNIFSSGVSSILMFVMSFIRFVVDVPLESIAGLCIAFSLAYIFWQFYILIKTYIKQKLRLISTWYQRQRADVMNMTNQQRIGRQPVRAPAQRTRRQPVRACTKQNVNTTSAGPTTSTADNSVEYDEKFCVICQERNKCVLLLPCRHLCLCTECSRELRYYDDSCPICRTNIDSTMKIYV